MTGLAAESNRWEIIRDVEFARAGELGLKLDLYLPRGRIQRHG